MSRPASGPPPWISFHLFLPPTMGVESFLIEGLGPWVRAQTEARRIKRFFFIRYSEHGHHVRLRFLPRDPAEGGAIAHGLTQCVDTALSPASYRLEPHRYDRTALYFGETRASVYAELLNEATSWLCLTLLASLPRVDRTAWRVVLAAVLYGLIQRAAASESEMQAVIVESRTFAHRAMGAAEREAAVMSREATTRLRAAVMTLAPRIWSVLDAEPTARSVVRLLRKARHTGARERLAATHALHLLCNKAGVSLRGEWTIFTILAADAAHEKHGSAG